jgi:hypothetical protein
MTRNVVLVMVLIPAFGAGFLVARRTAPLDAGMGEKDATRIASPRER